MLMVYPLMKFVERIFNKISYANFIRLLSKERINQTSNPDIIVSFTTIPSRVHTVWKTVVSLKRQILLPGKIILWISEEELKLDDLPKELTDLEDDFFEIRMVKDNLRSHKKYYYAFKEFRDKIIITVDDDFYYHKETVKKLLDSYMENPGKIISNRTRKIKYEKKTLLSYKEWNVNTDRNDNKNLLQIGVDGVLYPIEINRDKFINKDLFMDLSPFADDIWLNAISRKEGIEVIWTGNRLRNIPIVKSTHSLEELNVGKGLNDIQIKRIREYFLMTDGLDLYEEIVDD